MMLSLSMAMAVDDGTVPVGTATDLGDVVAEAVRTPTMTLSTTTVVTPFAVAAAMPNGVTSDVATTPATMTSRCFLSATDGLSHSGVYEASHGQARPRRRRPSLWREAGAAGDGGSCSSSSSSSSSSGSNLIAEVICSEVDFVV